MHFVVMMFHFHLVGRHAHHAQHRVNLGMLRNIPTCACLQDDERLYCAQDTPQRAFWTYWGDPAFDTPAYGTVCFGDLELRGDDTLFVNGLSDARMEVVLDLLGPLKLGTPKMQLDPFPRLEKPGRKASSRKRRRIR